LPNEPESERAVTNESPAAAAAAPAGQIVSIGGLGAQAGAPVDDPEEITALRERAATSLENGFGFVGDYGDAFAVLRANVTLEVTPPAECVEALARDQRDDGAFEPRGFVFAGATMSGLRDASVPAALVGTLEALSVLADLRAPSSGCAERAIGFLTRAQLADGSFGHRDPVAARPAGRTGARSEERVAEEGAVSADIVRDRLFVTGMLGGFAARTPYVRPEVLTWIARFLSRVFSPERVEGGGLGTIAAFAHFYANGGDPDLADEALQWCGRELERGFRTHRFEAHQVLRVLLSCDSTALPGATFDTVELLVRLLDEQAGDGGFAGLDPGGPPGRVAPTLDALMAIRALCHAL